MFKNPIWLLFRGKTSIKVYLGIASMAQESSGLHFDQAGHKNQQIPQTCHSKAYAKELTWQSFQNVFYKQASDPYYFCQV